MTHSLNVEFAQRYGIEGAIIIEQLYWWLHKNACESDMIKEDRVWCYFSARGLAKYIPYMNSQKLRRELKKLEDAEVVMVGNFNKSPINQTLWYSFTDKFLPELADANYDISDFSKMKNAIFNSEKCNKTIINNNLIEDNIIEEENSVSNDTQKVDDEQFLEFWEKYGYKKNRKGALSAFNKLNKKDKKAAIEAIGIYKEDCRINRRQMQHPATYLNKRTWEDDFDNDGRINEQEEIIKEEPMPAGMTREDWEKCEKWLRQCTPRICGYITPSVYMSMKQLANDGRTMAKIILYIERSSYSGDILSEFKSLLESGEYKEDV